MGMLAEARERLKQQEPPRFCCKVGRWYDLLSPEDKADFDAIVGMNISAQRRYAEIEDIVDFGVSTFRYHVRLHVR